MIKEYFQKTQFEWPFIFVFIYIFLQCYYHFDVWILVALFVVLVRIITLRNKSILVTTVVITLLILMRAAIGHSSVERIQELPLEGEQMQAVLYTEPFQVNLDDQALRGDGIVKIIVDNKIVEFKVAISKWLEESEVIDNSVLEKSMLWHIKGTMKVPPPARNFYNFDYQDYLKTQGIAWQFEIGDIIGLSENDSFGAKIANFRYSLLSKFTSLDDFEWIALHNKLLLNLDSDHYKRYQDNLLSLGVAHLFSISGFHIFFIRRLIQWMLLRGGMTVENSKRFISIFLIGYAWVIGWPVGVVRVLVMDILRELLRFVQISLSRLDILSLSALIVLLINPMNALSLGFTLSYFMTGIVIIYNQTMPGKSSMIQSFEMTVACLLFSWPIIIQTSFDWNVLQLIIVVVFSVFFNQIIMPLMFMTFMGIIISPPGFISIVEYLGNITSDFNTFLNQFSGLDILNRTMGYQSVIVLCMLVLTALFYLYFIHRQPYTAYMISILVYLIVVSCVPFFNPKTRLTMLDVGQGDALLVQMGNNRGDWLIDTGGRRLWEEEDGSMIDKEFAQRNIIPALKALGVHQLKGVIITHPDLDHIGNLVALSHAINIEEIWVSEYTLDSQIWAEISPELKVDIIVGLEDGRRYAHKNLPIVVYSLPEKDIKYSSEQSNDSSLIVQLYLGQLSVLMLGDITSEMEKVLLRNYPEIRGDILKLGHHGSDTSTSKQLLQHTSPILGLISAGVDNQYGHPHREVLSRLESHGIPYLSTNESGAIQISYGPISGYEIETVITEIEDEKEKFNNEIEGE